MSHLSGIANFEGFVDNIALWNLLTEKLYSDLDEQDDVFTQKPLLAHYTTLDTLEKILVANELWFSNPLFMNDLDVGCCRFHGHKV